MIPSASVLSIRAEEFRVVAGAHLGEGGDVKNSAVDVDGEEGGGTSDGSLCFVREDQSSVRVVLQIEEVHPCQPAAFRETVHRQMYAR